MLHVVRFLKQGAAQVLTASLLGSVALFGCSLKTASKGTTLSLVLPNPGGYGLVSRSSSRFGVAPATWDTTGVGGFQCYGVNVIGPGIADSSVYPKPAMTDFSELIAGTKSCSYRGVVSESFTFPAGGGDVQIDVQVPAGADRIVQLIGITDSNFCSGAFLQPISGSSPGAYEIGHVVADLFGDATVTIPITYAAVEAQRVDCINGAPVTVLNTPIIAYSGITPFTNGSPISLISPSNTGGAITSCSVSPALPAGLFFDTSNCEISGTPTAVSATANYTVVASSVDGPAAGVAVSITVNDVAPTISFTGSPFTYTKDSPITALTATASGGTIVSCAVSPLLPTGISLNASTCGISGTPSVFAGLTNYTVTATSFGGATGTATITITVNDIAPVISYTGSPFTYTKDSPITALTATASGGTIVSCAVSPLLPTGISLNASTCGISGTPSVFAGPTNYTVTATSFGGATGAATITITVNDIAPSISYSGSPFKFTKDLPIIPPLTATNSGGTTVSCAVAPALPAGLSLNSSTCEITGTPTALSLATNYTVTATSFGGASAGTVISIKIQYSASRPELSISAGWLHTCAVFNGSAHCWGANTYGGLGNGSMTDSLVPVQVQGLMNGVHSVVAGNLFSCAVVGGGAQCWGRNTYGQLGNNSTVDNSTPVPVAGLGSGVQSIVAGDYHACALVNGGVQCWGANTYGQLGNSSMTDSNFPVAVVGLTVGVQAITAKGSTTCALVNGGVKCWGYNGFGGLGDGTTTDSSTAVVVSSLGTGVQAITEGGSHTCALVNGGVKCWGWNTFGALGNSTTTNSTTPVLVAGLTSGVQAITAGDSFTCALVDGGAKCWGYNSNGQVGDGTFMNSSTPVQVSGLTTGVQSITAGGQHVCAVENGTLRCWGRNAEGEFGDSTSSGSSSPVPVTVPPNGVQKLASGMDHTCAVINGSAKCWGINTYGQLGDSTTITSMVPATVVGLANGVSSLSSGSFHTCALVNGAVKCWGSNTYGQLGDGTMTQRLTPVATTGLSGAQALSAGASHSCALVDGGVKCWGSNTYGQLGDNSTTQRLSPVITTGLSGAQALSVGASHSCALVNGVVKCWGINTYGQLGDGTTTQRLSPVATTGLSGAQALSVGASHSCALVDGGVKCWGNNTYGQLGDNTMTQRLTPVSVTGLTSGVQSIQVRENFSCAVLTNGGVKCWGNNTYGQLGDGTNTQRTSPVSVAGVADAQALSAGNIHVCAMVNSGAICWGSGLSGKLGNGSTANQSVPVDVLGF